jgi:hypothetical protein
MAAMSDVTEREVTERTLITFNADTEHFECRHPVAQDPMTYDVVNWCDHIERFFEGNQEYPYFWDRSPESLGVFHVPYVPSLDQWAVCKIIQMNDDPDHIHRLFVATRPYAKNADSGLEFLGFVSEGEGILTFRSMIHDWFQPRIDYYAVCEQASHSYAAEKQWNEVMRRKDLKAKLANRWSVFINRTCLYCSNQLRGRGVEADDLIPEASPPRHSW